MIEHELSSGFQLAVVITTRNRLTSLKRCLESVLADWNAIDWKRVLAFTIPIELLCLPFLERLCCKPFYCGAVPPPKEDSIE